MDAVNKISDNSGDRKYFVQLPQIVWDKCRDPYDITLWVVIKMIAGEHGECYLSTEDLATAAMMSAGKASESRQYLMDAGLIEGEIRKDPRYQPCWHLRVPDLWPDNIAYRQEVGDSLIDRIERKGQQREALKDKRKALREGGTEAKTVLHQVKPSPGEGGTTPGEEGTTPGETKKNHKKNHNNNQDAASARADVAVVAEENELNDQQQKALDELETIGVQPKEKAKRLARDHDPDTIIGWCRYAAAADWSSNPAGYVIQQLRTGAPPPSWRRPVRQGEPCPMCKGGKRKFSDPDTGRPVACPRCGGSGHLDS